MSDSAQPNQGISSAGANPTPAPNFSNQTQSNHLGNNQASIPSPNNPDPLDNAIITPTVGGRRKEVLATPLPNSEASNNVIETQPATETPTPPEQSANQPVEYDTAKAELEPEIEKLQAEIEQNKVKAPENIAVRQDNADQTVPKTVAQPVVILPLTEEKMKAGQKKSPAFSIRWLVAWAKRQVKKFKDILVVYRDSSYNEDKKK